MDTWAAACLIPLALCILLSGLDDLFLLGAFLCRRLRRRPPGGDAGPPPSPRQLEALPEKPIAVFVPLWREERVIGEMVEHNIAAIKYRDYQFFIGAYPNDEPTIEAVRQLESRFSNVHLCLCPHDGPTSKADCLNWIYQRMLLHEDETGARFDLVVTHDAEDLIHPEAFRLINYHADAYGMIQIPVLPLPTPLWKLTHGLYCDDFAEAHTKDLPVRQSLGGFIPSSGVGTGYCRWALDKLAVSDFNRVFEPSCLTEDYENGFRLHSLGCPQLFVPIRFSNGSPIATREFFPAELRYAVKQRTRWVTGIALQGWQRHGWSGGARQLYWLWRDRKGLIGNPVSLLSNLLFFYGVATWLASRWAEASWGLGLALTAPHVQLLLAATLALQAIHLAVRSACVARIYGWWFSLAVPFRVLYGNWLNSLSTVQAVFRFTRAHLRREPLVWLKTEHAYPSRATLLPHKRPIEEILAGSGYVTEETLQAAIATKPPGMRLCEYLVRLGELSEEEWYEALSLQLNVPMGRVEPHMVPRNIARALPAHVTREWKVFPYRIAAGSLFLASPELPSDDLFAALRRFTRLEIRFQLITPTNFRQLSEELL